MKTSNVQRVLLCMGIIGTLVMAASAASFAAISSDSTGLYNAAAVCARIISVPLGASERVVGGIWVGSLLVLAGYAGWMMELGEARPWPRRLLWFGGVAWLVTVASLGLGIWIVASAADYFGEGAKCSPQLLAALEWVVLLPLFSTLVLWGVIGWWIGWGKSPVPENWVRASPIVLLMLCLGVAWAAGYFTGRSPSVLYAAAPWIAVLFPLVGLLWHRCRVPREV